MPHRRHNRRSTELGCGVGFGGHATIASKTQRDPDKRRKLEMKRGVLTATALIGLVSLSPASSLAQGEGNAMLEMSRTPQAGATSATSSRIAVSNRAPTLEGVRPAAGMFPQQPTGPVRGISGAAARGPAESGDIRSRLQR